MPHLRDLFAALGAEDVATYVQSGNVVFKSPVARATELAGAIEQRISRDLGLEITVVISTKAQIAKVAAGNPFAGNERDPTKLHVTFLAAAPPRARIRELESKEFAPDAFHVAGKEIYFHLPGGYGRSKLSNAYIEKQLGVAATTRNWRTVVALAELAA
jgi:uncharacterized protein (DUF1697 family)